MGIRRNKPRAVNQRQRRRGKIALIQQGGLGGFENRWLRIIIAGLIAIVGFFAVAWIKSMELRIAQAETETQQIKLSVQADKARLETMDVQVRTLTAVLDRIDTNIRSIDGRLIKQEIVGDYRVKR